MKRGYAGCNEKYPAKSEFLRRTNVWDDVTEILRGKVHVNQKPERLMEVPIESTRSQRGARPLRGFWDDRVAARAAEVHLGRAGPGRVRQIVERLKSNRSLAETLMDEIPSE